MNGPMPGQVNLVVGDLAASLAFYRLLGWDATPTGPHAEFAFPNGLSVELDEVESVRLWNSGSPPAQAGSAVISLGVASRDEVDTLWRKIVEAGYESRQVPFDAFWGSRYAIVADPDGHQIGLMSPHDDAHRHWPPRAAPNA
ncbi:putative lactoylglutathione lyase [Asanoa ferruginea]|uniref:Putative lactoylglutathione lyase n=1 Tax=Asanoa ferruginea TaxID=53367 RepID=A0A3D9ZEX4_9ACTN|nr:VOC family protein [Asanoa ferruginea]REF95409.1 putative lactoylglutathione lyase [Asanoa ferruginea]